MAELSPIALFAWQRPSHIKRVLEALSANAAAEESDLFVFVDGPRHEREMGRVAEVIAIAQSAAGFKSVTVQAAPENLGLSRSITSGVTSVLQHSATVIVVEDDIVVSRSFLDYMNSHLKLYADDDSVASIHGYVYPHARDLPPTFFIAGADCWGWATWRRAWTRYRADGSALLSELRERDLLATFDFGGTARYVEMLQDQIAGRNDSWAVRWYASAVLSGMFTLYPNRSLVMNIGSDGSGSHGGVSTAFAVEVCHERVAAVRVPIADSPAGREAFCEFFTAQGPASGRTPALRLARRLLRPLWMRMPSDLRSHVARRLRR